MKLCQNYGLINHEFLYILSKRVLLNSVIYAASTSSIADLFTLNDSVII